MPGSKDNRAGNGRLRLRAFQVLLAVLLLVIWYVLTSPTLLPPIYFTEANPCGSGLFPERSTSISG